MEERNLRTVSAFLNSAYQEGRKCLNNEALIKLLDIREERVIMVVGSIGCSF